MGKETKTWSKKVAKDHTTQKNKTKVEWNQDLLFINHTTAQLPPSHLYYVKEDPTPQKPPGYKFFLRWGSLVQHLYILTLWP